MEVKMDHKEFNDVLKKVLLELKEKTLNNLLENDLNYQAASEQQDIAERDYLNLTLTKEQREIIEEFLLWTDISNAEYSTLSYLAGLYDGCKLTQLFRQGCPNK
jgi:hypothetical protein